MKMKIKKMKEMKRRMKEAQSLSNASGVEQTEEKEEQLRAPDTVLQKLSTSGELNTPQPQPQPQPRSPRGIDLDSGHSSRQPPAVVATEQQQVVSKQDGEQAVRVGNEVPCAAEIDWSQFGVRSAKVRALQKKPAAASPAGEASSGTATATGAAKKAGKATKRKRPAKAKKRTHSSSSAPQRSSAKRKRKAGDRVAMNESGAEEDGIQDSGSLFCVCRQPYDGEWMVGCDFCEDWFHPRCVGLTRKRAKSMAHYECVTCATKRRLGEAQQRSSSASSASAHLVSSSSFSSSASAASSRSRSRSSSSKKRARQQVPSPPRIVCALQQCEREARPNSRYCTDACGTANARALLLRQPELAEKQWALIEVSLQAVLEQPLAERSVADAIDLKTLARYEVVESESDRRMKELKEELEAVLAFEATLVDKHGIAEQPPSSSDTEVPVQHALIDCVSCGVPIAATSFARHQETCTLKRREKRGGTARVDGKLIMHCAHTNPRLNGVCTNFYQECPYHEVITSEMASEQVCGYPHGLDMAASNLRERTPTDTCPLSRSACELHLNWSNRLRARISQQFHELEQQHLAAIFHQRVAKMRIHRRHMNSQQQNQQPQPQQQVTTQDPTLSRSSS